MGFQVGDTVGDYQIIGLLGSGGMGKVYKVKNTISDRIDALKVLLPDLAQDPELADRFIREIKVLASLNHPNIAGLRTAFRLDNQLLMVMEYVEGTTLDERTKAGPIPLDDAISYIMQALSALGYAHKQGVIHRDIKPANMMLTPDNVVKLMDFGIAKSKSDKKLTQTGTTMGSLFYMSAEQVQGNELDGRSDLYSLGVSLYELVTGSRPFQGKSDFDIMVAQLQQVPVAPIQMMPDLPKSLNDIIMISLEKDPAKRFQSAAAFSAALGSISHSFKATPVPAAGGAGMGSAPAPSSARTVQASATGIMANEIAPALSTQPAAVGGAIPSAGGYIPTNNVPTIMAPQPTPPPGVSPGAPPALPAKSHRGLYMALGALVVVAILVLAALEVPRFKKARADGEQASQVATVDPTKPAAVAPNGASPDPNAQAQIVAPGTTPAAGSPDRPAGQATGAAGVGNVSNPPVEPGAAGVPGLPSVFNPDNSVDRGGNSMHVPRKAAKNPDGGANRAAGGEQVVPSPVAVGADEDAKAPKQNSAVSAQELEELGELQTKLQVRAEAEGASVANLRKQMQADGNTLRSDVGASQSRMHQYMQKFNAALNAGDAEAAKKYMGMAEHEVEFLEKFFGQ